MRTVPMLRRPHPKHRQCPVTEHTHPLVREFFRLVAAEGVALLDIAERAGVWHSTVSKWKWKSMPRLDVFDAALGVLGYELRIVRRDADGDRRAA